MNHVDTLVSWCLHPETGFGGDNHVVSLVSWCLHPGGGFGDDNQWTCVHV
jgi:hypothetical protein